MKYTYSCTRCGLRHELAEAAELVGGHFLCDGCKSDALEVTTVGVRDSQDLAQLTLLEFGEFIKHNPTRRA